MPTHELYSKGVDASNSIAGEKGIPSLSIMVIPSRRESPLRAFFMSSNNMPLKLVRKTLFYSICIDERFERFKNMHRYPVILSIEDHCSVDLQRVMAKYFQEILGEYLLTAPVQREGMEEDNQRMPSPEELKYKIIIKHKKIPKGQTTTLNDDSKKAVLND